MTNEQNPADDPWKGCNPMDPGFRDDPYPSLKRLREREPVNLTPVGIWRLMRHADVQKLLTDVKCGVRTTEGRLYGADDELSDGIFMLRQDPPNHSRLRKLVSHAFTPKALNAWQQEIQRVVDECLDRVRSVDNHLRDVRRASRRSRSFYPVDISGNVRIGQGDTS